MSTPTASPQAREQHHQRWARLRATERRLWRLARDTAPRTPASARAWARWQRSAARLASCEAAFT